MVNIQKHWRNPSIIGFLLFYTFLFLFHLLIQWLGRFIILIFIHPTIPSNDAVLCYVHGFRLDLSFTAYLTLLVLVLFLPLHWGFARVWYQQIVKFLLTVIYSFCIFIHFLDAELINTWGNKINFDLILFLRSPKEAIASAQFASHLTELLLWILISILFYIGLRKLITRRVAYSPRKTIVPAILLFAILGILARGGVGTIPILASSAYFSSNTKTNLVALNSGWNLVNILANQNKPIRIEKFEKFKINNWESFVKQYTAGSQNSMDMCTIAKPNVVLIIVESYSAYGSALFGKQKGFTPFLDSLAQQGTWFSNCFSPIERTPRAMVSIHSGFPGIPWGNILDETDKVGKLPMLPQSFAQKGYQTSFYYGGDIEFAEIKRYFLLAGYQTIKDISNFSSIPGGKWGIPDEALFSEITKDLDKQKQPFFTGILTLSSHEPYDIPAAYTHNLGGKKNTLAYFQASLKYTDDCLKHFFLKNQHKPWFQNTLFVVVADHGRMASDQPPSTDAESLHRIPLFFWSPKLQIAYKNKEINKICSQNDLAYTLEHHVLKTTANKYPFSRNLLDEQAAQFAFIYIQHGFALACAEGIGEYTVMNDKFSYLSNKPKPNQAKLTENMAKSIQYYIIQDYYSR